MDRTASPFRTELEFTLPKGYLDEAGVLHRRGTMRLATAADEILPLRDARVQSNPAYLTIIVLSRVMGSLGSLPGIDTQTVEGLFAADIEHLRRLYERINAVDEDEVATALGAARGASNGRALEGLASMGEA